MARIQHSCHQSIKPYKSSDEYLYAMKEDLAEWLKDLYDVDIDYNNILDALQTGTVLCLHANEVTRVALDFSKRFGLKPRVPLPTSGVSFVGSAEPGTFLARDNVSNFINWCRNQMGIQDVLMFETDDLVLRKNEKNFVLCLLEVARRASRFGMAAPVLIQLEEEIEEEEKLVQPPQKAPLRRQTSNTLNLDQMVQHLICRCTCPTQFPMVKVSDGKYRVGDSNTLIFVRILRNHVMVRVGGGWDTLEHYLDKHDPCRCASLLHCLTPGPAAPVHHKIRSRSAPCPDGPGPVRQPSAETPLRPAAVTPSSPLPSRSTRARASPSSSPGPRARTPNVDHRTSTPLCSGPGLGASVPWASVPSSRRRAFSQSPSRGLTRSAVSPDPDLWISRELKAPTPNRQQSTSTPSLHRHESEDGAALRASTRTGREVTRSSPARRLTSSLPRPAQRPSTPRPSTPRPAQRPSTPRPSTPRPSTPRPSTPRPSTPRPSTPQPSTPRPSTPGPQRTHLFTQSWTMSQISSKLRQSSTSGAKDQESAGSSSPGQGGRSSTPRPSTPTCGNMNPRQNKTPVGLRTNNSFHHNTDRQRNPAESIQSGFGDPDNSNTSEMYNGENLNELDSRVYMKPSDEAPLQRSRVASRNSVCSAPADDVQQAVSPPRLECSRERLRTIVAHSKPPPSSPNDDPVDAIHPRETSYNSVVAEHFRCTISCPSPNKTVSASQNMNSSLDVKEHNPRVTRSWPSTGSSVESKAPLLDLRNGVKDKDNTRRITMAATLNSANPGTDPANQDELEEPISTPVRPRRALKEPERIPSIYKLKYRPRGRPRHDHRPGETPSRIPTPSLPQGH